METQQKDRVGYSRDLTKLIIER